MAMGDEGAGLGAFSLLLFGAIALVVLTVTLLLGIALVGGMAGGLDETADPFNKTASPDPVPGTAVDFEDTGHAAQINEVFQVNDSTGYAINLTGADDSFVQSDEQVDLAADKTWTVATWARVDGGSSSETMTAVSADGRVIIEYNGSDGNWSAWYFEEGDTDSWRVNVSAPNQPGNLSLVTATANATHFWMYRNTTKSQVVNITGSNIEDVTTSAGNWHGTLDETRAFDDTTNDTEQSTLHSNPVAPRDERNRTARLMYDEGEGDTTAIYFTTTSASLSNATWTTDGLAGHVLTEGTDYTIDTGAGEITAIQGGAIDDAPVVWIDYEYEPLSDVGELSTTIVDAFGLFSTGIIAIPAVAVIAVILGAIIGVFSMMSVGGMGDALFGKGPGNR